MAETLGGLQRSLAEATAELEQQRREVTSHQEKEQVGVGGEVLGPPQNVTEPHLSPPLQPLPLQCPDVSPCYNSCTWVSTMPPCCPPQAWVSPVTRPPIASPNA